ncbi:MAG: protein-disulfide reductase DsbD domain-containing protein [Parachlamydiaceae bacterium]
MTKFLKLCLCLLCLGVASLAQGGESSHLASSIEQPAVMQSANHDPVTVQILSENTTVQAGYPFWIAIQLHIDKNWHAYWKNPGDAGMPPVINWDLPQGFSIGQTLWPSPKRFAVASTVGFGYEDELVLLVEIIPPSSLNGASVNLKGDVRWVVCSDETCLPGESTLSLALPVGSETPIVNTLESGVFFQARSKVPQKHVAISVQRKHNLLELVFDKGPEASFTVTAAEFFPEDRVSINYKNPPLLETSEVSSNQYLVILEEAAKKESVKGVLVLQTSVGVKAYDVDVPVNGAAADEQVASGRPIDTHHQTATMGLGAEVPVASEFDFQGGVLLAIALAFVGGMLLNLMPCVLPVISFKVLSFIKLAKESRSLIFKHGIAFSAGVLVSFWVLASLLLALQAYGRSVGWGFQLQEPLFVAILAAFIFVFGLSLFGIFELGTSIMSKAGEMQGKPRNSRELLGSFLSGILATAVATPCTGPFLGSAVGFAVTLPAYQAMLIFTSLGLGMSFPYLALAAFPSLLRFMPKPGPWMVTFKELMGFLMIASVLWLVWVFGAQTGSFSLSLLLVGFFFLSVACWIYGRWATPVCKKMTRRLGTLSALVFFAIGSYTIVASSSSWAQAMGGMMTASHANNSEVADAWVEFSPEKVAALREKGVPVFIDFTAKWCLICQANHLVLSTDEVSKKFTNAGVVRMKADWTKQDEVIAGALRKYGRNSVPLYVFLDGSPDSKPKILPQVLTPEIVLGALEGVEEKFGRTELE